MISSWLGLTFVLLDRHHKSDAEASPQHYNRKHDCCPTLCSLVTLIIFPQTCFFFSISILILICIVYMKWKRIKLLSHGNDYSDFTKDPENAQLAGHGRTGGLTGSYLAASCFAFIAISHTRLHPCLHLYFLSLCVLQRFPEEHIT